MDEFPEVLTVDEYAAYMRVTPETVRIWLRDGTLRGFKAGKQWRIPNPEYKRSGVSDDVVAD